MSDITLNAIWIGSLTADIKEAHNMREALYKSTLVKYQDYISPVSYSDNGLVQFMIFPCGSKDDWQNKQFWEALVATAARLCAGSKFTIKRLYVATF